MTALIRAVVCLPLIACLAGVAAAQENLAPNPGFEEGAGPLPDHWNVGDPGPQAQALWSTEARTGDRCLGAEVRTAGCVWWNCDLITVSPGQTYTLCLWYRCTNAEGGPPTPQIQAADGVNLIDWNLPVRTEWTRFRQSFTLGPEDRRIRIALINYHRAGQTIYWDDISLTQTFLGADGAALETPVALVDPGQTAVAERPYELGDRPPDFPPLLLFDDLQGWAARISSGMVATASLSAQQRIWGDRCLRLDYRWTQAPEGDPYTSISGRLASSPPGGTVEIAPPKPIEIPQPFDAVQLWVNGDNYYSPHQPRVTVRLLDGDGRAVDVCLGAVNWMYWFLMYGPAPTDLKPPVRFDRITVSNITNDRPLDLYFDALAFIQAPKGPISLRQWTDPLPFPTRAETILPSVRSAVRNSVRRDSDGFLFDCVTPDGPVAYRYEPRTGTLSDITATVPGEGVWRPLEGGGPVLVDAGPIDGKGVTAALVSADIRGDAVEAVWRVTGAGEPLLLTYSLRVRGKSLVIDTKADRPAVSAFSAGRIVGAPNPRVFWPPYANGTRWPQPHALITDGHFASVYFDWYNTESSAFYGAGEVASDGAARIFDRSEYFADTAGARHALGERIFLTVSNHFDEVLWNVPNPPSPLEDLLRTNLLVTRQHYGGGVDDYENELAFWKRLRAHGLGHLTIRLHADFWRSRETFTLKDQAAPAKGGDEVAIRYLADLRSLGYRVGLYTDYLLISPLSESWTPDMAALGPDGDRAEQAFATYFLKPALAPELQAHWAPRIHEKFGTSASYCDQMTQANTGWVEFDARVPGATQQKTVLHNWGRLLLNERVAHKGPCYSEGGYHALWAGLCDGSYAQTFQADAPPVPDFALRKLHPLGADAGYDLDWIDQRPERQIAMQIVYGNAGMLWNGPWGADVPGISIPNLVRCYFLMQQLQQRYIMEPVVSIRYFDGASWVDTDHALRTGAYQRRQVLTTYENGLQVAVNVNATEALTVGLGDRSFVLPPFGWAARDEDGFLEYSVLVDGRRQDYVESPEYFYFDGRGKRGREGGVEAAGQVMVLRKGDNLRVIAADGAGPVRLHLPTLGMPGGGEPSWARGAATCAAGPRANLSEAAVQVRETAETGAILRTRVRPVPRSGWLSVPWPEGVFAVELSKAAD